MIIISVETVPRFIGLYCNEKVISFESVSNFSKLLRSIVFNFVDPYTYKAYVPQNDFINTYIDKSKLDIYLRCKYEDELDIPKSLENELFKVKLHGGAIVDIYIDNYDYETNTLTIKIEK